MMTKQKCWMPWDPEDGFWTVYAARTRKMVVEDLESYGVNLSKYAGKVVRVEIRRIEPKAPRAKRGGKTLHKQTKKGGRP